MKRRLWKFAAIQALFVFCIVNLTGCYYLREKHYYSNENNFVTVTAEFYYINYDDKAPALYLGFLDLPEEFSDDCFKLSGENLKIVEEKGGEDCFAVGDTIEFITAPRYFGDGYVMPIVAISINGESLLDYEQGYENFMNSYRQQR